MNAAMSCEENEIKSNVVVVVVVASLQHIVQGLRRTLRFCWKLFCFIRSGGGMEMEKLKHRKNLPRKSVTLGLYVNRTKIKAETSSSVLFEAGCSLEVKIVYGSRECFCSRVFRQGICEGNLVEFACHPRGDGAPNEEILLLMTTVHA